jgi:hypothetical protein
MSAADPTNGTHSADVRMALYVNGWALPIAQLGPTFLVLERPADHPPTAAEIALVIDGRERRWPVYLRDGISSQQRRTSISRRSGDDGTAGG